MTLGSIWLLGGEVFEKNAVRTEGAKIASECTHCSTQYIYSMSIFAHCNYKGTQFQQVTYPRLMPFFLLRAGPIPQHYVSSRLQWVGMWLRCARQETHTECQWGSLL